MTEAEFLAMMRWIGLDPEDHDTVQLHAAHQKLTGLLTQLETRKERAEAQPLAVFNPEEPL